MDREACWHRFILFIPLSKEISHRFDSIIISFTKILWHFLNFRDYNILMKREEVEHSFVTKRQPWNDTPWAASGKWKLGERQSAYMQTMIMRNSWEWGAAPQRSWQQLDLHHKWWELGQGSAFVSFHRECKGAKWREVKRVDWNFKVVWF